MENSQKKCCNQNCNQGRTCHNRQENQYSTVDAVGIWLIFAGICITFLLGMFGEDL